MQRYVFVHLLAVGGLYSCGTILNAQQRELTRTSGRIELISSGGVSLQDDSTKPDTPVRLEPIVKISDSGSDGRPERLDGLKANYDAGELVQQLYPSGSPKISKHVTLSEEGDYVNHGEYQEWSPKGELVVSGEFLFGKQHGVWTKQCNSKDGKLFEQTPYNKFKAPFQSTAVFNHGKLNGTWIIADKDGKKISEIQLIDGKRHGEATWFYPSGMVYWQSQYKDGLLVGDFIEKDESGKQVRKTKFENGQRIEKSQEHFANKKPKLEYQFLTPVQTLTAMDDWNGNTLAVYEAKGEQIRHGTMTQYHENGSVRSRANYEKGVQQGEYASWYPSSQREIVGAYQNGKQHGKWNWWHENGMPKAVATYENGAVIGQTLSWDDKGQRSNSSTLATATPEPVPPKSDKPNTPKSSRSANNLKRPGSNK